MTKKKILTAVNICLKFLKKNYLKENFPQFRKKIEKKKKLKNQINSIKEHIKIIFSTIILLLYSKYRFFLQFKSRVNGMLMDI